MRNGPCPDGVVPTSWLQIDQKPGLYVRVFVQVFMADQGVGVAPADAWPVQEKTRFSLSLPAVS